MAVVEGGVRNHHLALVMRLRHMRRLIREQLRQHILKAKDLPADSAGALKEAEGAREAEGRWVRRWGRGRSRV